MKLFIWHNIVALLVGYGIIQLLIKWRQWYLFNNVFWNIAFNFFHIVSLHQYTNGCVADVIEFLMSSFSQAIPAVLCGCWRCRSFFLTSVLSLSCCWYSCVLAKLILPLINTSLLLHTHWIASRTEHSWYLYLPPLLISHLSRSGWGIDVHLKLYGLNALDRFCTIRADLFAVVAIAVGRVHAYPISAFWEMAPSAPN